MIEYDNSGLNTARNICRLKGSVFPRAAFLALPNLLITTAFTYCVHTADLIPTFQDPSSVLTNNGIWAAFSFLVGFLVVFRTSQSYSRFWEGCTQSHMMSSEWFDACSSLIAFTKYSRNPEHEISYFKNLLVRLFSMVHAAALGEIEDSGCKELPFEKINAFHLELIDVESMPGDVMMAVLHSEAKTELIMQWIQQLIVESISTGVLEIPAPILSRSFQEIATGMVHFHESMKISNVPFPFPYAQVCDTLLTLHWFIVPFVVSQWVLKPWWAGVFSFIQVFMLWSLNFIAIQLENPFGADPNDFDGARLQRYMNHHLRLLLQPETEKTPSFKFQFDQDNNSMALIQQLTDRALDEEAEECSISFQQSWEMLRGQKVRHTRRFNAEHSDSRNNHPRKTHHDRESHAREASTTAACINTSPRSNQEHKPNTPGELAEHTTVRFGLEGATNTEQSGLRFGMDAVPQQQMLARIKEQNLVVRPGQQNRHLREGAVRLQEREQLRGQQRREERAGGAPMQAVKPPALLVEATPLGRGQVCKSSPAGATAHNLQSYQKASVATPRVVNTMRLEALMKTPRQLSSPTTSAGSMFNAPIV